jgi:hypothetical protein
MMTGIMGIKRCGQCHFGKIMGTDLSKRVCWGAPPTALQVAAPGGQVTLRMARPVVDVSDEACALFRDRSEIMVANEDREQLGSSTN